MPKSTVQNIVLKFKKTDAAANVAGRGSKRKTSECTNHLNKQLVMKPENISTTKIATEVKNASPMEVCPQTVRNRLNEAGCMVEYPRRNH